MWKAITKQLFRKIFSYGCRKSWYAGEWSKPVPMAKSATTAATTALRRLSFAGECGEMFRRIHWNNRGCKSIVWRCISRLEPTGQECHARTVNEPVLENVVVQAINTLLGNKSTYQAQLQQNIAKVIRSAQQNTADGINERLQELQKELLKKANNKEAYDEIANEVLVKRWLERIIVWEEHFTVELKSELKIDIEG